MTFDVMPDMIDEAPQAIPQNPLPVLLFNNVTFLIFGTSMDFIPGPPIFPKTPCS